MSKKFVIFKSVWLFSLIIGILVPMVSFAVGPEEFKTVMIEQLEFRPARYLGISGHGMDADDIDANFSNIYYENGLQPLWVKLNGPGDRARDILEALKSADSHGLNPENYLVDKIEKFWNSTDAVGLARLDLLLTLGLRGYVGDMREGRAEPRKLDPKLFATARDAEIDVKSLREQVLSATDMKAFLDEQVPPFPQYHKLKKALKKYREIEAKGGWEIIPEGKVLKPGMEDERVPIIRKRLAATGDLDSDHLKGTMYDDDVVNGLKKFQVRQGLKADGVVGKNSLSVMNVTVHKRIRQIIINMERYRWIKHELLDRVIAVNIAGFMIYGSKPQNGEAEIEMHAIVGREYHKTPVFSDEIEYIEFNPYWNLPTSIVRNEMLPKLKKNPHYLKERNIRVFEGWDPDARELDSTAVDWSKVGKREMGRYKLRQDPGAKNALGTVKFMFPNKFNVYLHDTPAHSLFKETKRAFSHGCIRVSKPAELAAYILGGEENSWGLERIGEIIAKGKRTVVPLKKPFPIYILYRTAFVDFVTGDLHFRNDIYGRDTLLEKALF